jgi:hypothetical protein
MVLSKGQVLMLVLAFTTILLVPAAKAVFADQQNITNVQGIVLYVGDMIIIKSDQRSIERVFLQGNLSAASYTPAQYPTKEFSFTSMNPGSFVLRLFFNYTTGYKVDVQTSNQTTNSNLSLRMIPGVSPFLQITEPSTNSTTYYLSGGPSELDVDAEFLPSPSSTSNAYPSPSVGFLGWSGSFGDAFPLWVKLLYLVLGVQFFIVGGLWIKRESERRRSSSRMFDLGDKIYLWVDIAFRFLLVSFVALGLIMGGEVLAILILQYMFLITVTPLSLWNLFSLGFAFGAVVITYLVRVGLERGFDLKPMDDE